VTERRVRTSRRAGPGVTVKLRELHRLPRNGDSVTLYTPGGEAGSSRRGTITVNKEAGAKLMWGTASHPIRLAKQTRLRNQQHDESALDEVNVNTSGIPGNAVMKSCPTSVPYG